MSEVRKPFAPREFVERARRRNRASLARGLRPLPAIELERIGRLQAQRNDGRRAAVPAAERSTGRSLNTAGAGKQMARSRTGKRGRADAPPFLQLRSVALGRPLNRWTKADWKAIAIELAWQKPIGIIQGAMLAPAAARGPGRPPLMTDDEKLSYYRAALAFAKRSGLSLEELFEKRLKQDGLNGSGARAEARRLAEQLRNIGRYLRHKALIEPERR